MPSRPSYPIPEPLHRFFFSFFRRSSKFVLLCGGHGRSSLPGFQNFLLGSLQTLFIHFGRHRNLFSGPSIGPSSSQSASVVFFSFSVFPSPFFLWPLPGSDGFSLLFFSFGKKALLSRGPFRPSSSRPLARVSPFHLIRPFVFPNSNRTPGITLS